MKARHWIPLLAIGLLLMTVTAVNDSDNRVSRPIASPATQYLVTPTTWTDWSAAGGLLTGLPYETPWMTAGRTSIADMPHPGELWIEAVDPNSQPVPRREERLWIPTEQAVLTPAPEVEGGVVEVRRSRDHNSEDRHQGPSSFAVRVGSIRQPTIYAG